MKSHHRMVDFDQIIKDIEAIDTDTILLVIDHNVWSLYSEKFPIEKLIKNKKVYLWKAPDGEKTKTISEFESCLEFFIGKGVHRKAHLVAMGGGATSDFAGFVASALLRGVPWSVIPTTLLSMVDASIGGKVGVNSKAGKNLIGAFYLPENIWVNPEFLKTLPKEEIKSGKGEIIKYAFLSQKIFDLISNGADMEKVIDACSSYKLELTDKDFKEHGKRKILNLGHSFGHAFELIYNIPHGEAVMWGMVFVFSVFGNKNLLRKLQDMKLRLDWPETDPPWQNRQFPIVKVMEYLEKDKKALAKDKLNLVLAEDIGKPIFEERSFKEIENIMETKQDELRRISL